MNKLQNRVLFIATLFFSLFFSSTCRAFAYIDPGTLGSVYQFGYLIFYGIIAFFLFFFRPVKNLIMKIMGKTPGEDTPQTDKTQEENLKIDKDEQDKPEDAGEDST